MNTSFIERLNLTIRQGSAYLSRRTLSHARMQDTLDAPASHLRSRWHEAAYVEYRCSETDSGEAKVLQEWRELAR